MVYTFYAQSLCFWKLNGAYREPHLAKPPTLGEVAPLGDGEGSLKRHPLTRFAELSQRASIAKTRTFICSTHERRHTTEASHFGGGGAVR